MSRTGMANLITRVRTLVNDKISLVQDTDTGDGTTTVFWLTESPQVSGGTISLGGTVQPSGYAWDIVQGKVTFSTAPANAVIVGAEYLTATFSDDEIEDVLDMHVTILKDASLTWVPEYIGGGTTAYYDGNTGYRDYEEGTAAYIIRDQTGNLISSGGYTPDYITGIVRFSTDTTGTTAYFSAKSYDVYAAAADLWGQKAALYSDYYLYISDGQSFHRQAMWEHATKMQRQMASMAGKNKRRGDVQFSQFVSTDFRV